MSEYDDIFEQLVDETNEITKVDTKFITEFVNVCASFKTIKGILKQPDVVQSFETSLDMIDEFMKVGNLYNNLNSVLREVRSNVEFDYFRTMLPRMEEELNELSE